MRQAVDGHHHFADGAGHADHINARRVNIGGGIIDDRNRARGRESLCDRPCRRHGPAEAGAGNAPPSIVGCHRGGIAYRRVRRGTGNKARGGVDGKPGRQAAGAIRQRVAVGVGCLDLQTHAGIEAGCLCAGIGNDGGQVGRCARRNRHCEAIRDGATIDSRIIKHVQFPGAIRGCAVKDRQISRIKRPWRCGCRHR